MGESCGCSVQMVKEWLNAYRESETDIANQTEMLDRLISKMEGLGAKEITNMPRSPSPSVDRISSLMNQKIELEEAIAADVAALETERRKIDATLKSLKSANERAVIRYRYLIGLSWYEVSSAMFGGRVDFLDKEDSYMKQVFRLHGKALVNIASILSDKAEL